MFHGQLGVGERRLPGGRLGRDRAATGPLINAVIIAKITQLALNRLVRREDPISSANLETLARPLTPIPRCTHEILFMALYQLK